MALPISFKIRITSMFSNGSYAIRLSSLEQVWIFPLCSILSQCAAFPHCLSSGYKGSPARWHVRASTSTSISSVLFPDAICFWISDENQVVDISGLYEGYVDGKFEDCRESVTGTNSARWVRWWGIRTYIELKIERFYSCVSDRKCKYNIGHYKFRVFKFRSTLISQNFLNRETHENNV